MSEFDPVRRPAHYNNHPSRIECIEVTRHLPGNLANAFKYLYRFEYKGEPVQDLRKAAWYLKDQARHCEPLGARIAPSVVELAFAISRYAYDWRIREGMRRIVASDSCAEYSRAARLVEQVADEIESAMNLEGVLQHEPDRSIDR